MKQTSVGRRTVLGPTAWRLLARAMTIALPLASCESESSYRSSIAPTDRLTEEVAVRTTREAIRDAGYDASAAEPACYRQPCDASEPYFARNTVSPNRGYVLWRFKRDSRTAYQLSVTIERQGDQLPCIVGRVK